MSRQAILDRVSAGEIDPDEGEALAAEMGIGPLRKPDLPAEQCNPCLSPVWTLPMIVSWIVWRSFDEVRYEMRDHWDDRQVWMQGDARDDFAGWSLSLAPRARMDRINRQFPFTPSHPDVSDESVDMAIKALSDALKEGRLVAQGLDLSGPTFRRILPGEWHSLTHTWRPADGDIFYWHDDFARPEIIDVECKWRDVLLVWPENVVADQRAEPGAAPPPRRRYRTSQKKLIAQFFDDHADSPFLESPDENLVYQRFADWLEKARDEGRATTGVARTTFIRRFRELKE